MMKPDKYRLRILEISQQVPALHIAPAFSCLEIVDVIYHDLMQKDDTFIMSKGHGCIAQYVILEDLGILSRDDLDNYCNGRLGAHPDIETPGISASTGSLGHGLGIAAGTAYADKNTVYVILGDAEMQEGSVWEAMMMIPNLGLNNIIAFVDNNDFGGLERISDAHPHVYPLVEKAQAFGWESMEINGHNKDEIKFSVLSRNKNKPLMLVCKTVKGKGVSFMENSPIWHYRSPDKEEYKKAVAELT